MRPYYVMFIIFYLAPFHLFAKVDPPNYNFNLDQLKPFMPESTFSEAIKKFPKYELMKKNKGIEMYRFNISYERYVFPLFIQVREGIILDFYARLPAYFLHDIFHQSLINRLGKQDIYKKNGELAFYIWKNKSGIRHVYNGTCSITCFPVFYTAFPVKRENYQPLLEQFEKHL